MSRFASQHTFELATKSVEATETHLLAIQTLLEQQTIHLFHETTAAVNNLANVCPTLRAQLVSAAVVNDTATAETVLTRFATELNQLLAQVQTLNGQTQQCWDFINNGKCAVHDILTGFQVLHQKINPHNA